MKQLNPLFLFLLALGLSSTQALSAAAADEKVKVFILAGQSNMEGKGFPTPLTYQLTQSQYRERYTHFIKDGDFESFQSKLESSLEADPKRPHYDWSEREDVWVNYLGHHGNLTVGYASPSKCFGPEYNFGHAMGEHFEEQVLLIKTAWGGKSLGKDFLPPSAKLPTAEEFEAMAAKRNESIRAHNEKHPDRPRDLVEAQKLRSEYGHFYREMLKEVRGTLDNLSERFPSYAGQGYELAGFVWFQGWNDQFNPEWSKNYGTHLGHLIQDVRRDLAAPELRFVIGQVGFDGLRPTKPARDGSPAPRTQIKQGQLEVSTREDFQGTVATVRTDRFWDMDADAIYRGEGGWKKDVDKWRQFGDDRPYHYYGSPWFFAQIGTAFGTSMISLLKD